MARGGSRAPALTISGAWERWSGIRIRSGDAIFLRTGRWARQAAVGPYTGGNPGWHASVIPLLHQRDVWYIGSDHINDVLPKGVDGTRFILPVHQIVMPSMGINIFDNLDLEALADLADRLGRYEFLLTVGPLRVDRGLGSPAESDRDVLDRIRHDRGYGATKLDRGVRRSVVRSSVRRVAQLGLSFENLLEAPGYSVETGFRRDLASNNPRQLDRHRLRHLIGLGNHHHRHGAFDEAGEHPHVQPQRPLDRRILVDGWSRGKPAVQRMCELNLMGERPLHERRTLRAGASPIPE